MCLEAVDRKEIFFHIYSRQALFIYEKPFSLSFTFLFGKIRLDLYPFNTRALVLRSQTKRR